MAHNARHRNLPRRSRRILFRNSCPIRPDAQLRESDLEAQIHDPKATQSAQEIEEEAARGEESVGH